MFFVRFGSFFAWMALIFGAFRSALALFVMMQNDPQARAAFSARYFSNSSSGEALDQSVVVIGFAIALGVLVHIARSVDKRQSPP